jgi:hypothetical protein
MASTFIKDQNRDLTIGEKLPRVGYVNTLSLNEGKHIVYDCEYSLYYSFKNAPAIKTTAIYFGVRINGLQLIRESYCLN